MSWLQKAFKAATHLHFFAFGRVDISSLLMVSENRDMMLVDQNEAILYDSGPKNPNSASVEAFAAHLSQIIVDLTWQSCFRMHKDKGLDSSISEKIIIELLFGSHYFFAIAIRFPLVPLVPFEFSSGSHHGGYASLW